MGLALILAFAIGVVTLAIVGADRFWFWPWYARVGAMLALIGLCISGVALSERSRMKNTKTFDDRYAEWQEVPLRLRLAPDLSTYDDEAVKAANLWSDHTGCQMFRIVRPEDAYDVRFVFAGQSCADPNPRDYDDKAIGARMFLCHDGTMDIEVEKLDDIRIAYRVFAHELGHALTLAHDEVGVMAPSVGDVEDLRPWFPDVKDTDALRARYCKGGK